MNDTELEDKIAKIRSVFAEFAERDGEGYQAYADMVEISVSFERWLYSLQDRPALETGEVLSAVISMCCTMLATVVDPICREEASTEYREHMADTVADNIYSVLSLPLSLRLNDIGMHHPLNKKVH